MNNLVKNAHGTPIAGFISSIDARQFATRYAKDTGATYTVEDYAGGVTVHTPNGWAVDKIGAQGGGVAQFMAAGGKGCALLF